jgi:hypothetical protein
MQLPFAPLHFARIMCAYSQIRLPRVPDTFQLGAYLQIYAFGNRDFSGAIRGH